jgi:hypothetical protein
MEEAGGCHKTTTSRLAEDKQMLELQAIGKLKAKSIDSQRPSRDVKEDRRCPSRAAIHPPMPVLGQD